MFTRKYQSAYARTHGYAIVQHAYVPALPCHSKHGGDAVSYQSLPIPDRWGNVVAPEAVRRLVFCSGKVYFDLVRARGDRKDVAIVTIEQIDPFPFDRVAEQLKLYSNVDPVRPGFVVD